MARRVRVGSGPWTWAGLLTGFVLILVVTAGAGAAAGASATVVPSGPPLLAPQSLIGPPAPTGLSQTGATTSSVAVSWSGSLLAAGYDVYVGGTKVGTTSASSYTVTGLACGTSYAVSVDAYDALGDTSATTSTNARTSTCPDTAAPTAPSGLRVTAGQKQLALAWTASTDNVGVAGYHVYVNGSLAGTTASTSYTSTGLACGTTYTLAVDAYDAAGNTSAKRSATGATTACSVADTTAPTAPSGLKASPAQTQVGLSWTASTDDTGVAGYHVYVSGAVVGTTTSTTYTASGLSCGTSYTVAVDAYDAAGNTSGKATTSATTSACSSGSTGASLYLAPSGSDSGQCTQAAPCRTFNRAYHAAQPGDVVQVAGGTYPGETISADTAKPASSTLANVVFKPASGASVTVSGELRVEGSHVEFHDMKIGDWYAGINSNVPQSSQTSYLGFYNVTAASFYNHASYVNIVGGSYGPLTDDATQISDCDQCNYSPQHILIDGVYFHDFVRKTSGIHMECLHVYAASYLTVRNSRFYNCAIMDLFINNYSGSPDIHDITVENNFFDTPGSHGGSLSSGSYSLYITPYFSGRSISNIVVRNNTSLATMLVDNQTSGATIRNAQVVGNLGEMPGYQCVPAGQGVTYSHNVWYSDSSTPKACGSSDTVLSGGHAAAGFADYANFDLHLTSGSPAIDAADPSSYPATDIDGQARPLGSAPDAGADEHA